MTPLDACEEARGGRTEFGYIRKYDPARGRARNAHRLAWERAYGPIPKGMCICHRCDNPPCVKLSHLFLGTYRDNTLDAIAKGRHKLPPRTPRREVCVNGHSEWAEGKGRRRCRVCARAASARFWSRTSPAAQAGKKA